MTGDHESLDDFVCDWQRAGSRGEVELYRRHGWHLGAFAHGVWSMARARRGTGGTFSALPTLTVPVGVAYQ